MGKQVKAPAFGSSAKEARTGRDTIERTPRDRGITWGESMANRKIGRDAGTGKFKPVKDAERDKKGSVVETIKIPPKPPSKPKK